MEAGESTLTAERGGTMGMQEAVDAPSALAEVERAAQALHGVTREAGDLAARVARINGPLTEYTRAVWQAVERLRAAWNATKTAGVADQARPVVADADRALTIAVGVLQQANRPAVEAWSRLRDAERAFDRLNEEATP